MSIFEQSLVPACELNNEADVVSDLIQRSAQGNAALMRGDIGRYTEFVSCADDFLLMSPFGGAPSRASDYTPERMQAMDCKSIYTGSIPVATSILPKWWNWHTRRT